MGIREIRFCDISGSEENVEPHEIHIDALRVEIDLADAEYRKLLELLRPYTDAGRLDASAPETASLPVRSRRRGDRTPSRASKLTVSRLTASERDALRRWAESQKIPVPANNRFKASLVDQWRHETGQPRCEDHFHVAVRVAGALPWMLRDQT